MKRLLICLVLLITIPVVSSNANPSSSLYTGRELLTEFLEADTILCLKEKVNTFLDTHKNYHIVDMDYSTYAVHLPYDVKYKYSVMIVYLKK